MNRDLCAVSSCYFLRDGSSLYCRPHLTRVRRAGDPTKRVILKRELRGFQKLARGLVRRTEVHPAWLDAVAGMKEILRPPAAGRKRYKRVRRRGIRGRPPASRVDDYVTLQWTYAGILRRELQRLQDGYRPSKAAHGGGRLKSKGLLEDALEYATAAFLFAHAHPRLLDDGPNLTHQIGSIILRLAPLRSYRAGIPNKPPLPRWPSTKWRTQSKPPPTRACRAIGERVRERLAAWFALIRQVADASYPNPSIRSME